MVEGEGKGKGKGEGEGKGKGKGKDKGKGKGKGGKGTEGGDVKEQQKILHQPVSQPWASSPTSVAKLGLTESDFYSESEKAVPYKFTHNHPNRDQTISAVVPYEYTQNHPNRDQNISATTQPVLAESERER